MVRRYLASLLLLATPALAAVELDGDSNGAIDVAKGGTNATTAAGARTALGVQPLDSDLTSIAGLATTAWGRGLLDDADAAAGRTSLGIAPADTLNVAGVDLGTGSTTTGLLRFYGNTKAFSFGIFSQGADGLGVGWQLPSTIPAATSLLTVDSSGYMAYLDPSAVSVTASGFDGNLATTDNTLQKVAQKVDDLVISGAGDDLGSAAYGDVVALWTTCTGYLKSDGTCDTPSGSATYPSAAGVANWGGSAWGTSYTVGTAANNLVQLNSSAQLPAVSGALLTNIPMPAWLPSAAPTADNMIIQATGGCSDSQYTDQATCEANSGTWTPPVGAWTSIIDGLINDAGTGTDDLLSASEIDSRISAANAFYQVADGDLDTVAGADTAGNSKLFGTNSSGTPGWYDIPVGTGDQTASEVNFTPNGSIAAVTVQAAVQEVRDEAEPALGNPATTGYVLSSTTAGVRSWVAQTPLVDEIVYQSSCSGITNGLCIDTDDGVAYYYTGSAVAVVDTGISAAEPKTPSTLALTTDTSVTAQQIADNKYISNYGASGEVDIVLPAISYNQTRTILIESGRVLEISPPSGEALELSGTDLTANYCINSGSVVGNKATATRLRTGASTWKWSIDVVRGTWESCGASSD